MTAAVSYLLTEVLGGDGEDLQAAAGLCKLGLQALKLPCLLLAALPQFLHQGVLSLALFLPLVFCILSARPAQG